tara:strand:+ start:1304 stop:1522 length:219 start_codon:yes stop_codon:yes gene_type:complete
MQFSNKEDFDIVLKMVNTADEEGLFNDGVAVLSGPVDKLINVLEKYYKQKEEPIGMCELCGEKKPCKKCGGE